MWSLMTLVLFVAFILMVIILFLNKDAYQNAEKIIFKEDNDAPINPRKNEAKS